MSVENDRHESDALLRQLGARLREERDADDDAALPPGISAFDEAAVTRMTTRILGPTASKALHDHDGDVVSLASPRARRWAARAWWAAPALAAAVVALWIGTRGPAHAMPDYELSIVSVKSLRATNGAVTSNGDVTLDPTGDFELVARPTTPASDVAARAVIVRDGTPEPWAPPIEVSSEGSVRIHGATRSLFPDTRGSYEVVVLVGREGSLPPAADVAWATATEAAPSTRIVRARIHFAGPRVHPTTDER